MFNLKKWMLFALRIYFNWRENFHSVILCVLCALSDDINLIVEIF